MESNDELKKKLDALQAELKGYFDKAAEEQKKHGGILDDTVAKMTALQKQVDAIDSKLAERATQHTANVSSIETTVKESESIQRLYKDRRGTAVINFNDKAVAEFMQRKTTITETALGTMTTGVLPIDRIPGITPEARQVLTIRDLLYSRPTAMLLVDFVKVSVPLSIASPVPEASLKPENQLVFVSASEKIRTIATWIPASKQVLDDLSELMGFIQSSLPYYVNLAEELQLLSGDGTGENLHGLIPQSTPFNKGFLPATGATKMDAIGGAIAQITTAHELQPTFVVMHPQDWWSIRLAKDSLGRYILGDPQITVTPTLFGLTVDYTTSIGQGSFLVGSGSPIASEIRDRMEMQVEVSTEHMDFFVKNLVAIRAEKRLALVVKRPGSYVAGTFTGVGGSPLSQSPVNGG